MRQKKTEKYTEAQAKAQKKYMSSFEHLDLRMTAAQKALIRDAAAAAGESMNTYALNAIEQRIERESLNS